MKRLFFIISLLLCLPLAAQRSDFMRKEALMPLALSCLSLREHYDEVVLYTDTPGKRILINELHLPYTDVQVVFDDFPCLPQHWALA